MIKKFFAWIGALVAFLSLVVMAVGVFVLERENDDIYREITGLERRVEGVERDLHEKEKACEVLEATIQSRQYKHTYKCE
ncbi:MAG: hypothetical protein ACN2B6_01280 [Rickettsiales bacterium]